MEFRAKANAKRCYVTIYNLAIVGSGYVGGKTKVCKLEQAQTSHLYAFQNKPAQTKHNERETYYFSATTLSLIDLKSHLVSPTKLIPVLS